MDDLKTRIWDYLYRLGRPQQIEIIADEMNETLDATKQIVDDPWFDVRDGMVSIAQRA